MSKRITDTEEKIGSALSDEKMISERAEEISEKNLEIAIKKGFSQPYVKAILRIMIAVLLVVSIAMFATSLMRYTELRREKESLENKVEKYEAEVEKLEYLINCPVDYDYIVRVAKEKLNLYLPDEIVYHNDTNN